MDGDSFVHRAYHALPKSMRRVDGGPANALIGFSDMLMRLWRDERPRDGPRRVGHARRADVPSRGARGVSEWKGVRRRAARAARSPSRTRGVGGFCVREGRGLRGGRLPRRSRDARGSSRRRSARRDLGQGCVPARHGACDRSPAGSRRSGADRAGRGAGALRRRSGPGAGLHRAPRRSVGQDPRRARDR